MGERILKREDMEAATDNIIGAAAKTLHRTRQLLDTIKSTDGQTVYPEQYYTKIQNQWSILLSVNGLLQMIENDILNRRYFL